MIDPGRHLKVFNSNKFADTEVHVIGVGATGSNVVYQLAKLGLTNIHAWDFDKVEAHNIANQIYGNPDIGKLKVEALHEIIKRDTGISIHMHPESVTGKQTFSGIVFLLTDTMESRKTIFEKSLELNPKVPFIIETRMGVDEGRVYVFSPINTSHIKGWKKTLYSDTQAATSVCGASITVGPTATFLASLAVWQFIDWINDKITPSNEIFFTIRPFMTFGRSF